MASSGRGRSPFRSQMVSEDRLRIVTDAEKYLFDVLGFVILEDVLSPDELNQLNQLIDRQTLEAPRADDGPFFFGTSNEDSPTGLLGWGKPFCDLLDHPKAMEALEWMIGVGPRIEQVSGVHACEGSKGQSLHAASHTHYDFRNGRVFAGLTVVSWNLSDGGGAFGGFCCIPGSHKVNYTYPVPVEEYPYPIPPPIEDGYEDADFLMVPKVKAGSVLIFTEALTHGSVSWKASYERRSLLYKYGSRTQQHVSPPMTAPTSMKLTDSQRFCFEPPGPRPLEQIPRRTGN